MLAVNKLAIDFAFGGLKFKLDDLVRKTRGSQWHGRVVGFYSTNLTPIGYAVESSTEHGSVQIYPESALELQPEAA
jgi:dihydrofolate reductase (trimethoprim resistance protein)